MEMARLLIPFPIWNSLSLFGLSLQLSILNLALRVCCVGGAFLQFFFFEFLPSTWIVL